MYRPASLVVTVRDVLVEVSVKRDRGAGHDRTRWDRSPFPQQCRWMVD